MQREPYNDHEAKDAMAPLEPGIGQLLAQARAAKGLSIEDVAEQLKFGARQLAALEEERFGDLPGSTVARGMVRGYARLLKLDTAPLLAQLEGKFEVPDANRLLARYRQPVPFSDNSRRSNLAYAALSIAVLAVVAAVAFEWQQERSSTARLAFVPAARVPLESASAPSAPPVTADAVASVPAEASAPAVPRRAVAKPIAAAAPKPPSAAAPSTALAPAPKPPTESSGPRVVLRFEEESWVEVRDGTGSTLMAQLNPAGSVRVVRGEPPFSLVIGNAQHVQVVYAGKIVDLTPHIRVEVARLRLE